jgi:hypothetical protein
MAWCGTHGQNQNDKKAFGLSEELRDFCSGWFRDGSTSGSLKAFLMPVPFGRMSIGRYVSMAVVQGDWRNHNGGTCLRVYRTPKPAQHEAVNLSGSVVYLPWGTLPPAAKVAPCQPTSCGGRRKEGTYSYGPMGLLRPKLRFTIQPIGD